MAIIMAEKQSLSRHHVFLHARRHILLITAVTSAFIFLITANNLLSHLPFMNTCRQTPRDGGDCQAFPDTRRPSWACPKAMLKAIPEFVEIYNRRPIKDNAGGMRFDHSFALWYTLRSMNPRPKFILESGAFNGQSTWFMKETLPEAKIFSMDPRHPLTKLPGVTYMTNESFQDFVHVNWKLHGVDPEHTLVFFDDHQSGFRRVYREGVKLGFWRFIMEDNYAFLAGDNMSLKWVCERERRDKWPGMVQDRFGTQKAPQSWEEHFQLGEEMERKTKIYYEFPPVASTKFTGQTRFDERYSTTPIARTAEEFEKYIPKLPAREFAMYTHFSYVELKR